MIILLSPAKTMNFMDSVPKIKQKDRPFFINNAININHLLRTYDSSILQKKMNLSDKLLAQVTEMLNAFSGSRIAGRQAIFAYRGAVFTAMDSLHMTEKELLFSNNHIRILSGFYGVLKPLDVIEEYRLEMKTSMNIPGEGNLIAYWKRIITDYFKTTEDAQIIVNLASNEFSKVINFKDLPGRVINVSFSELSGKTLKSPPMYSKIARGMMAGYIIRNYITDPEDIKNFNINNYSFNNKLSTENKFIFTR